MEVDTGAGVSIIPFSTWRSHFPDIPLQSSAIHAIQLKTYTNEKLYVLGQHDVTEVWRPSAETDYHCG